MKRISLALLLIAATSSAFAPQLQPCRLYGDDGRRRTSSDFILLSEKNDDAIADTFLSSPLQVDGRGEKYVLAQFSLLFCIAIGTIPLIGDALASFLGPSFIVTGLALVYKSAADLKDNLSPWPVATDPKSGRGSLISDGIYSYVRHPMYSGLLFGMIGLSIFTDSTFRLMLTFLLYVVLDAKSDFEEASLEKTYGSEYAEYTENVQSKFFPLDIKSMFISN
jgi:protein-S-isoprenylcysteine O-methyltransferase Ste14